MRAYKFYKITLVMFFAITILGRVSFALVLSLRNGWFRMPDSFSSDSYRILSGTFYAKIHTDRHAVKKRRDKGSYKCVKKKCVWRICLCVKKQRDVWDIYTDEKDLGNLYVGDTFLFYSTPYYSEENKKSEEYDETHLRVPYYSQYYDKITGYAGSWEGSAWLRRKTLNILESKHAIPIRIHRAVGDYPIIDLAYLNLNVKKLPPPQKPKKDIVPEPQNILIFLVGILGVLLPQQISRMEG